jgi:curved DNA-binding protein CbpA
MLNPYQLLHVTEDATDEEIRKSYLQLVKLYTPDKHPQQFEAIRAAYEKISDLYKRVSFALLSRDLVTKAELFTMMVTNDTLLPFTENNFRSLLAEDLALNELTYNE